MTKIKSEINLNLSSVQIIQDVFSPIISVLPKMKQRGEAGEVSSLRVLIVEDEAKLLNHLERMIRNEGFSTFTCTSFSALELLLNISVKRFDVVVLDRLLHGRDTATLITQIKHALPEAKVLILSAIDTPAEKAQLLDLGADDYVAKPFDSDELIARIRVLLRRATPELRFGNVIMNAEKRTIKVDHSEIALQNKEFALLRTLLRSPGRVFNKTFLYENVWEMSTDVESNVVEATVNKLRRRLEELGANFSIKSMRHKGYWIEE